MARKHWIWITITIAIIHGLITFLLTDIAWDILFWRFDGNPYKSPLDRIWLVLFILLNLPYFILSDFVSPLGSSIFTSYLVWVGNSLVWGLLGAWLISKLPFMISKQEEPSSMNDGL